MSSFFVSDATVDCAITLINRLQDQIGPAAIVLTLNAYATPRPYLARMGCAEADQLGRALLCLNAAAVMRRYHAGRIETADSEREMNDMSAAAGAYRYDPRTGAGLHPLALLKQLVCLIYQCEEFDKGAEPQLLLDMRAIENRAAGWIVSQLPEYAAAPWGVDARLPQPVTKQPRPALRLV